MQVRLGAASSTALQLGYGWVPFLRLSLHSLTSLFSWQSSVLPAKIQASCAWTGKDVSLAQSNEKGFQQTSAKNVSCVIQPPFHMYACF